MEYVGYLDMDSPSYEDVNSETLISVDALIQYQSNISKQFAPR
ncbi:uncharacterized protein RAG0_06600 [Rhynchosporium agropyri]|uniref:Uncharacterized protein n=1 Tax=Rhynchosporium agropyri TaxID=914238 RepID=A0A1E1KHU4_9HELO|nr:uncharacterized protein RAG0_06600 [Rhynchosporium agropyri]